MIDPQKEKYWPMYWDIALRVANESKAQRAQVGCVVITRTGMISLGWNGLPSGMEGPCEWQWNDAMGYDTGRTKPSVIHAERNTLDKMSREGISPEGGVLLTTCAPCLECAKSIHGVGITKIGYINYYKNEEGLLYLMERGVRIHKHPLTQPKR